MTTTIAAEHRTPRNPDGGCVASYPTAHAALLAVEHLTEQGFSSDSLTVAPAELHPVDGWLERTQQRPRRIRPVAVALAVAAVAFAAAAVTSRPIGGWIVAGAVVAAIVAAFVTWRVDDWVAARTRARARAERAVEAERFDVICDAGSNRAAHVLARWWNPAAPPVPSSRLRWTNCVDTSKCGQPRTAA